MSGRPVDGGLRRPGAAGMINLLPALSGLSIKDLKITAPSAPAAQSTQRRQPEIARTPKPSPSLAAFRTVSRPVAPTAVTAQMQAPQHSPPTARVAETASPLVTGRLPTFPAVATATVDAYPPSPAPVGVNGDANSGSGMDLDEINRRIQEQVDILRDANDTYQMQKLLLETAGIDPNDPELLAEMAIEQARMDAAELEINRLRGLDTANQAQVNAVDPAAPPPEAGPRGILENEKFKPTAQIVQDANARLTVDYWFSRNPVVSERHPEGVSPLLDIPFYADENERRKAIRRAYGKARAERRTEVVPWWIDRAKPWREIRYNWTRVLPRWEARMSHAAGVWRPHPTIVGAFRRLIYQWLDREIGLPPVRVEELTGITGLKRAADGGYGATEEGEGVRVHMEQPAAAYQYLLADSYLQGTGQFTATDDQLVTFAGEDAASGDNLVFEIQPLKVKNVPALKAENEEIRRRLVTGARTPRTHREEMEWHLDPTGATAGQQRKYVYVRQKSQRYYQRGDRKKDPVRRTAQGQLKLSQVIAGGGVANVYVGQGQPQNLHILHGRWEYRLANRGGMEAGTQIPSPTVPDTMVCLMDLGANAPVLFNRRASGAPGIQAKYKQPERRKLQIHKLIGGIDLDQMSTEDRTEFLARRTPAAAAAAADPDAPAPGAGELMGAADEAGRKRRAEARAAGRKQAYDRARAAIALRARQGRPYTDEQAAALIAAAEKKAFDDYVVAKPQSLEDLAWRPKNFMTTFVGEGTSLYRSDEEEQAGELWRQQKIDAGTFYGKPSAAGRVQEAAWGNKREKAATAAQWPLLRTEGDIRTIAGNTLLAEEDVNPANIKVVFFATLQSFIPDQDANDEPHVNAQHLWAERVDGSRLDVLNRAWATPVTEAGPNKLGVPVVWKLANFSNVDPKTQVAGGAGLSPGIAPLVNSPQFRAEMADFVTNKIPAWQQEVQDARDFDYDTELDQWEDEQDAWQRYDEWYQSQEDAAMTPGRKRYRANQLGNFALLPPMGLVEYDILHIPAPEQWVLDRYYSPEEQAFRTANPSVYVPAPGGAGGGGSSSAAAAPVFPASPDDGFVYLPNPSGRLRDEPQMPDPPPRPETPYVVPTGKFKMGAGQSNDQYWSRGVSADVFTDSQFKHAWSHITPMGWDSGVPDPGITTAHRHINPSAIPVTGGGGIKHNNAYVVFYALYDAKEFDEAQAEDALGVKRLEKHREVVQAAEDAQDATRAREATRAQAVDQRATAAATAAASAAQQAAAQAQALADALAKNTSERASVFTYRAGVTVDAEYPYDRELAPDGQRLRDLSDNTWWDLYIKCEVEHPPRPNPAASLALNEEDGVRFEPMHQYQARFDDWTAEQDLMKKLPWIPERHEARYRLYAKYSGQLAQVAVELVGDRAREPAGSFIRRRDAWHNNAGRARKERPQYCEKKRVLAEQLAKREATKQRLREKKAAQDAQKAAEAAALAESQRLASEAAAASSTPITGQKRSLDEIISSDRPPSEDEDDDVENLFGSDDSESENPFGASLESLHWIVLGEVELGAPNSEQTLALTLGSASQSRIEQAWTESTPEQRGLLLTLRQKGKKLVATRQAQIS